MPFTLEELKAAELAQGTLEESELAAVSGGRTHYGLCLGFGTSFKRSGIAFCFVIGEIEPE